MKKLLSCSFLFLLAAACPVSDATPQKTSAPGTSASIALDPNFNAPFFAEPNTPYRAVLLPDSKYVVFHNINTLTDQATGALIRFNSDGTLDTTFSFSRDYPNVRAVAAAPDGKLIISARHPLPYGVARPFIHETYDILRLNSDGSVDSSFGPAQTTDGALAVAISIAPDGKILVGGFFTHFNGQLRQGLVRLLPDGTVDSSLAPITLTSPVNPTNGPGVCGVLAPPLVDADGKIIIGGDFVGVNGVSRPGVARLNSDGSLDTTFVPSGVTPFTFLSNTQPVPINDLGMQSSGKIIIGGRFVVGSSTRVPLLRLNTDGSRDTTYAVASLSPASLQSIRDLLVQADDKVVAVDVGVWRFNADGSLDTTFHNPELNDYYESYHGLAFTIGRDSDGSYLVGGIFTDLDDPVGPFGDQWGAGRLNPDGTVRTSFTTAHRTGLKFVPSSFERPGDGTTLIAFNSDNYYDDIIPHNFGRLLTNGSRDVGFDPIASFDYKGLGPNFVAHNFALIPDGTVLISGVVEGNETYGRLLPPDWNEDPSHEFGGSLDFDRVFPRADGKITMGSSWYVERINSDGSGDNTFQLDQAIQDDVFVFDENFNLLARYVGGGVLCLSANNTTLSSYLSRDGTAHLVRLNDDGSIDSSFPMRTFPVTLSYTGSYFLNFITSQYYYRPRYVAVDFPLKQAKALAGDKVLLMGSFASYDGTPVHGIVRLNSDGSIDPTFNVGGGAQWTQTQETGTFHPSVDNLEILGNGKILLTGTFEAFNGTPAPGIVLLNPDFSVDASFVPPVARQKYDYQPAYLKAQTDGSLLLSGPYARSGQTSSPSFLRLITSPTATSIVSRKVHGGAGAFDIDLPEAGPAGIECRSDGAANDYQIVVTFSTPVTVNGNPQAQVTLGSADVGSGGVANGGVVSISGNTVTIPLTNVTNAQLINVTLSQVSNGTLSSNLVVPVKILIGDANGNGVVNASDVALTKSRIGQAVDGTNFRSDVNANGTLNASDAALVKSRIGSGVSTPGETARSDSKPGR